MNKLLIVCGPTATGKTSLAVSLAKKFDGELISADSRQVYKGMDIGTGKDKANIDVPIWLYDVAEPSDEFSVSHYVTLARSAIADIIGRGKLPIVVGGTGLYIQALLNPPETMNIPPNKPLRERLSVLSLSELQAMVERGPINNSDWNNPRRLIRKIEIAAAGIHKEVHRETWDTLMLGLTAPLPFLFKRIDERVEERIRQGVDLEVAGLVEKYGRDIPAMSALGYRSRDTWAMDEHAYARRQMTWFKKQPAIQWFDITKNTYPGEVIDFVTAWYTKDIHE